uniref:Uncharacterized protein n=1 Tax=Arundo donax TaxID=35708 RepID=A0A0A9CZP2_ARUDO
MQHDLVLVTLEQHGVRDPIRMVGLMMGCMRMCCAALGFAFVPVRDPKDRFLEHVTRC